MRGPNGQGKRACAAERSPWSWRRSLALVLGTGLMSTAPVAAAATTAYQVVTVSAPSSTSTYATVEAWQLQRDGRYLRVARFANARIGSQGMGATSESLSRTPAGQHQLSQPFGLRPNPGNSGVPYFQVDKHDIWTGSNGAVLDEHGAARPAPVRRATAAASG